MSKTSSGAKQLNPTACRQEFSSIFKQLCGKRRFAEVWSDCMEIFAIVVHQQSYYNPAWMPKELEKIAMPIDDDFQRLEESYMRFVTKYEKEGMNAIAKLYALAQYAVQQTGDDFLGHVYESLEIVSKRQQDARGEFLTPATVSKLMAKLTLGESIDACIQRKGYVTCQEPACGSGRMLLALVDEMYNLGHDPRVCLFVEAIDVSRDMWNMTYSQLSWRDIPARVIHGNTLSMEVFETRLTPQYKLSRYHHEKNPVYQMLKLMKDCEIEKGATEGPESFEPIDTGVTEHGSQSTLATSELVTGVELTPESMTPQQFDSDDSGQFRLF